MECQEGSASGAVVLGRERGKYVRESRSGGRQFAGGDRGRGAPGWGVVSPSVQSASSSNKSVFVCVCPLRREMFRLWSAVQCGDETVGAPRVQWGFSRGRSSDYAPICRGRALALRERVLWLCLEGLFGRLGRGSPLPDHGVGGREFDRRGTCSCAKTRQAAQGESFQGNAATRVRCGSHAAHGAALIRRRRRTVRIRAD